MSLASSSSVDSVKAGLLITVLITEPKLFSPGGSSRWKMNVKVSPPAKRGMMIIFITTK